LHRWVGRRCVNRFSGALGISLGFLLAHGSTIPGFRGTAGRAFRLAIDDEFRYPERLRRKRGRLGQAPADRVVARDHEPLIGRHGAGFDKRAWRYGIQAGFLTASRQHCSNHGNHTDEAQSPNGQTSPRATVGYDALEYRRGV
jgi:hypothetical protein